MNGSVKKNLVTLLKSWKPTSAC